MPLFNGGLLPSGTCLLALDYRLSGPSQSSSETSHSLCWTGLMPFAVPLGSMCSVRGAVIEALLSDRLIARIADKTNEVIILFSCCFKLIFRMGFSLCPTTEATKTYRSGHSMRGFV